ncbi:MAG: ABC transporter permease [Methanoregulaceae archaeon]|nr:ABC transporter permease [Methanoregulaceae archaeon]
MGFASDTVTVARWEVKRSVGTMGRNVLPVAIALIILLLVVTGYTTQSGIHLQDRIYRVGTDDPAVANLFSADPRFSIYVLDPASLQSGRGAFDLTIQNGTVVPLRTDRGRAAAKTLARDYDQYRISVYNQEQDLFAAYPLWLNLSYVKSELDFAATQSGQQALSTARSAVPPVPEAEVQPVELPAGTVGISEEELRSALEVQPASQNQLTRYTEMFGQDSPLANFKTPSQLSPPLPFDSIILIFVFIFPLYFSSQFFMMSIMNERIGRRGEVLLSTPARPAAIIAGKALPYFLGMLAVSGALILWLRAPPEIILPLIPVILFFLASALLIGMVSRSFKELSFISIFFSTVATSYLFFPSIFANVHIVSLVSPITLIILLLQGTTVTPMDYVYSTSLFILTSVILFYIGVRNFREERLFSQDRLLVKFRDFIGGSLPEKRPYLSLFVLNALVIPFVFMAQLMLLVILFNLPMPLSLVLLLVVAALVEEIAKSIGITTLFQRAPAIFSWKMVVIASLVTAAGFLFGEKLLLFITLSQISDSVFGSVLFLSLGLLWLPFLLHFGGTLVVGASVKKFGWKGYVPGLAGATILHCLYNIYMIRGWFL